MSAFVITPVHGRRKTLCVDLEKHRTVSDLKTTLRSVFSIEDESYFLNYRGVSSCNSDTVQTDGVYHVFPKVLGGKGGFGSMLRAIGAQIEKTTNREACRDLSGRRMRDVNNEKKLKDWIAKKADREREKERVRKERLARRLAVPKHNFEDPNYEDQKTKVADNLEDALQSGLQKYVTKAETSLALGKRSIDGPDEAGPSKAKASRKSLEWMGIEGASDLDSDVSSESDSEEACDTPQMESKSRTSPVCSDGENNCQVDTEVNHNESTNSSEATSKTDIKHSSLLTALPLPVGGQISDHKLNNYESNPASLDLENFASAEELEQLGLDALKAVLMSRGLKCGGTLQQRAERLFSVKGLSQEEIDPSLFAKPQNGKGAKKKKS